MARRRSSVIPVLAKLLRSSGHETIVEGLEARGIPHWRWTPPRVEGYLPTIEAIAHRAEVPQRARRGWRTPGGKWPLPLPASLLPRTSPILIQWWPPAGHRPRAGELGLGGPGGPRRGPRCWTMRMVKSRPLEVAEVGSQHRDAWSRPVRSGAGEYRTDVVKPATTAIPGTSPAVANGNQVFCIPRGPPGAGPGPAWVNGSGTQLRRGWNN